MGKRESGVDLYRCLGLLFVTGLHAFLYNGFYTEAQGMGMWGANSARWLFSGCNGMFMLMTGYLKGTKRVDRCFYRGLITVLLGYTIVFGLSVPVRFFLFQERDGWTVWVERFFTFEGYAWYVEMYIGLMLLSLLVNPAIAQITTRHGLLGIAVVMLSMTAFPTLTPAHILPDYWTSLYPVTYYVLGAVIRRLELRLPPWIGLLGGIAMACFMGLLSSITARGGDFVDGFAQGGYGGCLTTMMVTMLFLGVYRLELPGRLSSLLSWLSGGVFEGFLLSRLLDVWVYDLVKPWHDPSTYWKIFLCVTVPIFVGCACAGRIVHSIAIWLTNQLFPKNA